MNQKKNMPHPVIIHTIVVILLLGLVLKPLIVPTESMNNTIVEPALVFGINIHLTSFQRGDILAFKAVDENTDKKKLFIKRLIGMPGDTVQIYGDKVIVNGVTLQEDYLPEPPNPYEGNPADYDISYEPGESTNGLHFYDFDGNEVVWKYRPSLLDDSDPLTYYSAEDVWNTVFFVPDGCYFFLGDNRNHSDDSRVWEEPFIKEEQLKYKALFNMFPFRVFNAEKGGGKE